MCGQFDLDIHINEVRKFLDHLAESQRPAVKVGSVFPGQFAAVRTRRRLAWAMTWGFPNPVDGKRVIYNARAETAFEKPMFSRPLAENRVALPTTGFFEWSGERGAKTRYRFVDPDAELTWIAGFGRMFDRQPHFTLLTTAANDSVRPYHHRMPVVLKADEVDSWLEGGTMKTVLSRVPFALSAQVT